MSFFQKLFGKGDNQPVKYSTVDYNIYFDNKTIGSIPLVHLSLGKVALPTGRVIACDPLVYFHDSSPFNKSVSSGNYSVTACIAKTEKSGDRFAAVKLDFNNSRPTKWQMAVHNDNDLVDLKEEEIIGFPVDAGLGCFFDLQAQKTFTDLVDDFYSKNPNGNFYDDYLAAEFKKNAFDKDNPNDIGSWLNFQLPNKPDLNIVMFNSGYGDGLYASYWGTNDKGEICCLVVDFDVL